MTGCIFCAPSALRQGQVFKPPAAPPPVHLKVECPPPPGNSTTTLTPGSSILGKAFWFGSVYNHTRVSLPSSHTNVALSWTQGFGYNHTHIKPCIQCTNYDAYRVSVWRSFTTSNFAYLQVIFNHIDHVSHYFRKIWPLYADDIISIL